MYLTIGVLAVAAAVAYWVSLRLHPFRRCHRCSGTGKLFGAVFAYSHRPCRNCAGSGRKPRFGTRHP